MKYNVVDTFTDRKGRTIEVDWELDFVAYHGIKEVGRMSMYDQDFDKGQQIGGYRIKQIFIEDAYQKAGIGLNLLRVAFETIGYPVPVGNWSPHGDNPLLPSGRGLMERGVSEGYVEAENVDDWVLKDD